jgi:bifunctional non-homologous end joining protein LigD
MPRSGVAREVEGMPKSSIVGRDTSITAYRTKRNFAVTPEPPARQAAAGSAPMFVVQKHSAHRAGLHWDFRLEHGGVLWSWAVPKGPSLDPADKRMAIHVEDHPIDYADFEGTIPAGNMVAARWKHGTAALGIRSPIRTQGCDAAAAAADRPADRRGTPPRRAGQ